MIPLQLQLILGALLVAGGFVTGWKVNNWKHGAEYAAMMEGGKVALERTADALAKLDVKQVTIKQEVQTRVIEKPVYRDCRHDADAYRLLNDSLTGKSSAPVGSGKLPEADSFIGRLFRGNNAEAGGSE